MDELLTTREAADLLGVATSSVKRWADSGLLQCVRTPGGHRRFPRDAILSALFRGAGEGRPEAPPADVESWMERLTGDPTPDGVYVALIAERERLGAWWSVADAFGPVLIELGQRWEKGQLTVLQEHLASERLTRGLVRVANAISVDPRATQGLLLTAPEEDHVLGLRLAELVLREAGVATRWSGRRTPLDALSALLDSGEVQMVAVSASVYSSDADLLAAFAARTGSICRKAGADLLLGGRGAWPEPPPYGTRLTDFCSLRAYLEQARETRLEK
jgi:excisionase family DNA binding protein